MGEQVPHGLGRLGAVTHDHGWEPGRALHRRRAPEFVLGDIDAGELADHHRTVHEGVGTLGHHHEIHHPEQECRTGYRRSVDDGEEWDATRAPGEGASDPAPTVQRRDALVDVGAGTVDDEHQRQVLLEGHPRAVDHDVGHRRREGRSRFDIVELDPHDPTIPEQYRARCDRTGDPGGDRQFHS